MSTQKEPSGTIGHVKGMAASVHTYTSTRGSTFPRLHLTIDYRDRKHIRLRAYDADGQVVDTLAANDVAEAILLAGQTIRYGETMHARPMRGRLDGATPRPQANYDGERVSFAALLGGYERAVFRFMEAAQRSDAEEAFYSLFEALNWAVAIGDIVGDIWRPEGVPLAARWVERVERGAVFAAVRYARNRVHHQWADALRPETGKTALPFNSAVLVWRGIDALPQPRQGNPKGISAQKDAYATHLEGRNVAVTLSDLGQIFQDLRPFLLPPLAQSNAG